VSLAPVTAQGHTLDVRAIAQLVEVEVDQVYGCKQIHRHEVACELFEETGAESAAEYTRRFALRGHKLYADSRFSRRLVEFTTTRAVEMLSPDGNAPFLTLTLEYRTRRGGYVPSRVVSSKAELRLRCRDCSRDESGTFDFGRVRLTSEGRFRATTRSAGGEPQVAILEGRVEGRHIDGWARLRGETCDSGRVGFSESARGLPAFIRDPRPHA
jgi:hypothetical protein